jgi:hypothetical protein
MNVEETIVEEELAIHPLAEKTPPLTDREYEHLKQQIASEGLLLAIVLYQGRILDGRNRYRVCRELGIPVRTRVYEGDDPIGVIASLNATQRHMDVTDRVLMAFAFVPEYQKRAAARKRAALKAGTQSPCVSQDTDGEKGDVRELLGERFGVAGASVQRALDIHRLAPKELDDLRARRWKQKVEGKPRYRRGDPKPPPTTITGVWRVIMNFDQDGRSDAERIALGISEANVQVSPSPWTVPPPKENTAIAWRLAFRDLEKVSKAVWDQNSILRSSIAHREGEWALKARSAAVSERRWMEQDDRTRAAAVLGFKTGALKKRDAAAMANLSLGEFERWCADLEGRVLNRETTKMAFARVTAEEEPGDAGHPGG